MRPAQIAAFRTAKRRTHKKKGSLPMETPFSCKLAEWTGLEPATPGVTGRYSNQLNYHSKYCICRLNDTAP